MGHANRHRQAVKQLEAQTLAHVRTLGEGWSPTAEAWLQENFVRTLVDASLHGADSWQNQVYLASLKHEDAAVRRGIRMVMTNVFTAGLQPGRTVFGLVVDAQLARREVVGEFDHCKPLEAWVAQQLGVAPAAVFMRHSCLFAPAHAGLFCITTTLYPVATPRPAGVQPTARTRAVEDDVFRRQALLFLVSVESDKELDLGKLADSDFSCELNYWGPEEVAPASVAAVRPVEPVLAFEGVELLSFRLHLANAAVQLGPWRELDKEQTLLVRLEDASSARRFLREQVVVGRLEDTDMPEKLLYQGPDTEFFLPHLDRLGVKLKRC